MTDGERLVWAAIYAIALDRGGDSIVAARAAAIAVAQLRETSTRQAPEGSLSSAEIDERDFLDEIVNAP